MTEWFSFGYGASDVTIGGAGQRYGRRRSHGGIAVVIALCAIIALAAIGVAWVGVPNVLQTSTLSEALDHVLPSNGSGQAASAAAPAGSDTVGENTATSSSPWGYFRSQLSSSQLGVYDALYQVAENDLSTVDIPSVSFDDASFAFDMFMYDHPEFFWIDGWSYVQNADGSISEVGLQWSMDTATRDADRAAIDATASTFLAGIDPAASTYDRVKATYEYVILNTSYMAGTDDQDIVGVFMGHTALCAGYSRAFQYLLHLQGIECAYVTGQAYNGDAYESHAWNLVVIDGVNTFVDCTWGDQGDDGATDGIAYGNFCITSDEIGRSHTPDYPGTLPACTDTTYDYYRLSGGYFDSYDHDAVLNYLMQGLASGETTTGVKFGSDEAYAAACADLFDNAELSYAIGTYVPTGMQYHYSTDDSLRIITVRWS